MVQHHVNGIKYVLQIMIVHIIILLVYVIIILLMVNHVNGLIINVD